MIKMQVGGYEVKSQLWCFAFLRIKTQQTSIHAPKNIQSNVQGPLDIIRLPNS